MSTFDPAAPWQRLGQAPGYRGYVTVRRDTYRLPDGTESDWDVLEQADTVAVVAFTQRGTVLLFEQFRVGPARTLGELPGGLIDPGEDAVAAAARELEEETGYRAGVLVHAGSEWAGANSTRRKHIVVAADCRRVAAPRWEMGETGRVQEIGAGELVPHLLGGDLSDAGAAMRALHAFARSEVDDGLAPLRARVRGLLAGHPEDPADEFVSFWAAADLTDAAAAHRALEAILGDRDDARAAYERASLHDSLGEEAAAVPLYRAALAGDLDEGLRTQATIQLASSLRNVGDASGAITLLQAVPASDPLYDSARAFLALALFSDGKPAPALREALQTLAPHLPRYQRAVRAYADELLTPDRVRVIAVGLLVQDGWVLGEEYAGSEASGPFLRLPGGGVEFGERADDAVRREFAEELGVTLDDAHLLGIIENIFDRPAKRGHEIVYVYGIRCAELEALPRDGRLPVRDADTTVGWYRIDTLAMPLHPDVARWIG